MINVMIKETEEYSKEHYSAPKSITISVSVSYPLLDGSPLENPKEGGEWEWD